MAATEQRLALQLPWATLLKILVAVALIWMWRELAWLLMLTTIAIIIAVGLEPAVSALEQRRWPRWLAASVLVLICVGAIGVFLIATWSSLYAQGQNLSQHLRQIETEVEMRMP